MLSGPSLFSEIRLGTILWNRSIYGSPTPLHIQAKQWTGVSLPHLEGIILKDKGKNFTRIAELLEK